MAYTKLRDLLDLATELQASSIGLTISEMMERTERSRATVERMLAGLYDLGLEPKASVLEGDHHLTKRWRLETKLNGALFEVTSQERSALERLHQSLESGPSRTALGKVLAEQRSLSRHIAIDQQTLIDRTAHIGSIGPRTRSNDTHMALLETCIQGFERLNLCYRAAGKAKASWRIVEPLGLVFGRFGYLVARSRGMRITYRLDLIEGIEQTGEYFEPGKRDEFKAWVEESFGIFHGDKRLNVRLRFHGEAAKRAENVSFHPAQRMRKGRGKTLIVEMSCRGHKELIHELLHPDWIGQVQIEAPDELKQEFLDYLTAAQESA